MAFDTIVFHGPSGCGKDTQVDLLEKKLDFVRIGASSIMFEFKEKGHPLALEAAEYGKKGKRYPDELVYGMFEEWLETADASKPWFFLSPVRKDTQIVLFDKLLKKFNRNLDKFVHFNLSEKIAIERLSLRTSCSQCKTTYHSLYKIEEDSGFCDLDGTELKRRSDDEPDAIKSRLAWYESDIHPILNAYRERGLLLEIDASQPIDTIQKELTEKLGITK